MIATPSYDGKVDVRYADALIGTFRSAPPDISIFPVFIPGDALVQRARNSLCKMALDAEVDDVVFIDGDMAWQPDGFFRLLSHAEDVVGGLYRQKTDQQTLVFRPKEGKKIDDRGLLEVAAVGAGFLRISSSALKKLWKASHEYNDGPVKIRSVFEIAIEHGELLSEDVSLCHKWTALKGKVYLDPGVLCEHVGTKVYSIEPGKKSAT